MSANTTASTKTDETNKLTLSYEIASGDDRSVIKVELTDFDPSELFKLFWGKVEFTMDNVKTKETP